MCSHCSFYLLNMIEYVDEERGKLGAGSNSGSGKHNHLEKLHGREMERARACLSTQRCAECRAASSM